MRNCTGLKVKMPFQRHVARALSRRLVMFFLLSIVLSMVAIHFLKGNATCLTEECRQAADDISRYIDTRRKPCHNFYTFACGNFFGDPMMNKPSLLQSMEMNKNTILRKLVTGPKSEDSEKRLAPSYRNLRKYYRLCTDIEHLDRGKGYGTFFNALDDISESLLSADLSPELMWQDLIVNAKNKGLFYKFVINVTSQFDAESGKFILHLAPPSHEYLDWLESLWKPSRIRKIISAVADNVRFPFWEQSRQKTEDIELYGLKLLETIRNIYSGPTVRVLEERIMFANFTMFGCRLDKFITMLTGIKSNPEDIIINHFPNLNYFLTLKELDYTAGTYFWFTYATINIIYHECENLPFKIRHICSKILLDAGLKTEIIDSHYARRKFCFEQALSQFPGIAEAEYIRREISLSKRRYVEDMVDHIKTVLLRTLWNTDIIDPEHYEDVKYYFESIETVIGWYDIIYDPKKFEKQYGYLQLDLPNNIIDARIEINKKIAKREFTKTHKTKRDLPVEQWGVPRLDADAYYDKETHSIVLLAPILDAPIVDEYRLHYLNYGALGSIIGHLLINAYEEKVLVSLTKTAESMPQWKNDLLRFRKNQLRLIDFDYFIYTGRFNNVTTLDDNVVLDRVLGDVGGANLAFRALKIKSQALNFKERKLLGLDYPPAVIFWVMSSIYLCQELSHEEIVIRQEQFRDGSFQYHAKPSFRVNAPKMASSLFEQVFHCNRRKVHIWSKSDTFGSEFSHPLLHSDEENLEKDKAEL